MESVAAQAWPASELCLMRLLKQLALHAATLRELPKLLGSCHASSQDALQLVRTNFDTT